MNILGIKWLENEVMKTRLLGAICGLKHTALRPPHLL